MTSSPRTVTLLGSTGSIGTQAIEVVQAAPDRFRIIALSAGGNLTLLARQAVELQVEAVGCARGTVDDLAAAVAEAAREAGQGAYRPELLAGPDAAAVLAGRPTDVVLNGITGSIGLAPTLAALDAGTTLALANKESLIVGGPLVKAAAKPGQIVPVDSEHSALAQCLRGRDGRRGRASRRHGERGAVPRHAAGRAARRHAGTGARPPHLGHGTGHHDQLRHPGQQGPGGHRGPPALRRPVRAHPRRGPPAVSGPLDGRVRRRVHVGAGVAPGHEAAHRAGPGLAGASSRGRATGGLVAGLDLGLLPLDDDAFPAVGLAKRVGQAGGTYPAVYNAANEECVQAFFDGRIRFTDIVDTVARVVDDHAQTSEAGINSGDLDVETVLRR